MRTEKRVAKVGEIIVITKPEMEGNYYKKGDKFRVTDIAHPFNRTVRVQGIPIGILHREYEVVVPEPTGITRTKLKTEKRKAEAGERILITEPAATGDKYKK